MSKIDQLKREAARARVAFDALLSDVDCGIAMLKEMSPRASQLAQEYNAAMGGLQQIDPNFPKDKFIPL